MYIAEYGASRTIAGTSPLNKPCLPSCRKTVRTACRTPLYFVAYSTVSIRVLTTDNGHSRITDTDLDAAPDVSVAASDSVPSGDDSRAVMALRHMK